MCYPCSENKHADQLRGYREADLRLCFRICKNPVFSRRGSILTGFPTVLLDCMSRFMRKPTFIKSIYKGADRLRGRSQHLCFRYAGRTIPLLSKSEISSLYTHLLRLCSPVTSCVGTGRTQRQFFLMTRLIVYTTYLCRFFGGKSPPSRLLLWFAR